MAGPLRPTVSCGKRQETTAKKCEHHFTPLACPDLHIAPCSCCFEQVDGRCSPAYMCRQRAGHCWLVEPFLTAQLVGHIVQQGSLRQAHGGGYHSRECTPATLGPAIGGEDKTHQRQGGVCDVATLRQAATPKQGYPVECQILLGIKSRSMCCGEQRGLPSMLACFCMQVLAELREFVEAANDALGPAFLQVSRCTPAGHCCPGRTPQTYRQCQVYSHKPC